jgi:hypothetical protein
MRTLSQRCQPFTMLIALALLTPPLIAVAQPEGPFVGPNHPPLIDSTGSGFPNADDHALSITRSGNVLTLNSPWDCGNQKNLFTLSDKVGSFYQTVSRTSGGSGPARTQVIHVTAFDPFGNPTAFSFTQSGGPTTLTGTGTLLSSHNNGIYDTMQITETAGGSLNTLVNFIYFPNGEGLSEFISIPWGQAEMIGAKNTCGGSTNPQVYLPLTGDGHVILATNGTSPDPDLLGSPVVAPLFAPTPPVPALAPIGLALLAGLMLVAALRFLRRTTEPQSS